MLFDTKSGAVRLRWSDSGITAIEMPELSPRAIRAELLKQNGAEPPAFVREGAKLLAKHLDGEPQDLGALRLDLSLVPPFQRTVSEAIRSLPPGRTATSAEVAALCGKPGASRAVGQALGRNPFLVAVPCHRVLGANGKPGGFSAPGGLFAKQRLLAPTVAERLVWGPGGGPALGERGAGGAPPGRRRRGRAGIRRTGTGQPPT